VKNGGEELVSQIFEHLSVFQSPYRAVRIERVVVVFVHIGAILLLDITLVATRISQFPSCSATMEKKRRRK
jgi:hypothetical protein